MCSHLNHFTEYSIVAIVYSEFIVFVCLLADIADAICFLLVGPSDLAAKSSVEVFISVGSVAMKIVFINAK